MPLSAARARQAPRTEFGSGRTALWPAAALAASFAVGLYLGISGIGTTTLLQTDYVALNDVYDRDSSGVLYDGVLGEQEELL